MPKGLAQTIAICDVLERVFTHRRHGGAQRRWIRKRCVFLNLNFFPNAPVEGLNRIAEHADTGSHQGHPMWDGDFFIDGRDWSRLLSVGGPVHHAKNSSQSLKRSGSDWIIIILPKESFQEKHEL